MKLQAIFSPELNAFVKFKVLEPSNAELFLQGCQDMHPQEFRRYVVDHLVYNLRSELFAVIRNLEPAASYNIFQSLYYGCLMLNPSLDVDDWLRITYTAVAQPAEFGIIPADDFSDLEPVGELEEAAEDTETNADQKPFKLPNDKLASLKPALQQVIIGQDDAIEVVSSHLRRSIVGLGEPDSPIGVFLLSGSSGTGKTLLARSVHDYVFGKDVPMARIDCGQYQERHDAQRLAGASNGYIGYDDGGILTNQVEKNPNTVVLLDEVEKAHPDFWNAFLNIFDEGFMLNNKGKKVDFRNTIIMMTSNLGNKDLLSLLEAKNIGFGGGKEVNLSKERINEIVTDKAKQFFRPELLNRIDEIVVFNHLKEEDLTQIATMEMEKVATKLSPKGIRLKWTDDIIKYMTSNAAANRKGARGMANIRRKEVEVPIAEALLAAPVTRGSILNFVLDGETFKVNVTKQRKRTKAKKEA